MNSGHPELLHGHLRAKISLHQEVHDGHPEAVVAAQLVAHAGDKDLHAGTGASAGTLTATITRPSLTATGNDSRRSPPR